MTETNPPAAFDPDHLPTVAEFDDMVDHNRAHGRVFSFAPAVIRELLGELERLREELSQADTFGRGEFRVTTWAYEQAVRALGCAHQRIRELEAVVPDTGQAPESPTDTTPKAGRGGSSEAETTTDTVQAPDVAALLTRCDAEDRSAGEFGWIQTTEIRALLGTDTTPDRLAWISEAGETAAAERHARYQETACAPRYHTDTTPEAPDA